MKKIIILALLPILEIMLSSGCSNIDNGVPDVIIYEEPIDKPPYRDNSIFAIQEVDHLVGINESINFGSENSDPDKLVANWDWDFGDGTHSNLKNPSHLFATAGKNIITLTTIDTNGLTTVYKDSIYAVGEKWNFPVSNRIQSVSPTIGDDGTVYVASDDFKIFAINPNGTQKWNYATSSFIRSTPAIGIDGNVYVASFDDFIYAFNPTTGATVWTTDLAPGFNPNPEYSSPAIADDGTIYIGTTGDTDKLIAINHINGAIKWSLPLGDNINSTPVIGSDGTIYVAADNGKIYAITDNGIGGTILWEQTYGTDTSTSLALDENGTIYIAGHNSVAINKGVVFAYNPDGTVKWSYTTEGPITQGGIAITNGHLYVGTKAPTKLISLDLQGNVEWTYNDFNNVIGTNPAVDELGNVYIGDDSGYLSIFTKNGKLTYRKKFGYKAWSSPTISDDGVVCFGVDKTNSTSTPGIFYALKTGLTPFPSGWPMKSRNSKHQGRL